MECAHTRVQGTPEFMSRELRQAMDRGLAYKQGAIDDLWSFWYTCQWAILNSQALAGYKSADIPWWRNNIAGDVNARDAVYLDLQQIEPQSGYPDFLETMIPLLDEWYGSLRSLAREYQRTSKNLQDDQKLLVLFRFALNGVSTYAELLAKHRESLSTNTLSRYRGVDEVSIIRDLS